MSSKNPLFPQSSRQHLPGLQEFMSKAEDGQDPASQRHRAVEPGVFGQRSRHQDVQMAAPDYFMDDLPNGGSDIADARPFHHVLELHRAGPLIGTGEVCKMQWGYQQEPTDAGNEEIADGHDISP